MKTTLLSLLLSVTTTLHSSTVHGQGIPADLDGAENMGSVNMVPGEDGEMEFEEEFDPSKLTKADLEKHCTKQAKNFKCEDDPEVSSIALHYIIIHYIVLLLLLRWMIHSFIYSIN